MSRPKTLTRTAPPTLRTTSRVPPANVGGVSLRPRDAGVDEGRDVDRHAAVLELAREQADERRAHLDVADEHPAADQAVEDRALGPSAPLSGTRSRVERPDAVAVHELRIAGVEVDELRGARCRGRSGRSAARGRATVTGRFGMK